MKNNILAVLIALLSVVPAYAADKVQIGNLYYYLNSLNSLTKTATVTNPSSGKYSGNITIPSTVTYQSNTYSVTSIGKWAFLDCTGLTAITIPNSVTSIGEYALSGCEGLTTITIPNSVTSIGSCAFKGCTGLTSITIPNNVTWIEDETFSGCTSLTSVTIGNSVWRIVNSAFSGCSGLTSVAWNAKSCTYSEKNSPFADAAANITSFTFGNEVETIPAYLCNGMSKLSSVAIHNSVYSIGSSAFAGCTGLTSVVWNAKKCGGWRDYYYAPFYSANRNITSFTFGNEIDSIPAYLCYGMSKLTVITIPNSVTSIGSYAFYGCTGLTSITIPNSLTSIGEAAFCACEGLTAITIPDGVTSIGEGTFYKCTSLTTVTIPNSVTSIGDRAFDYCTGLQSVTIPNGVTSIGNEAFSSCTGLTSITIPNNVTSIGSGTFQFCSGLTSITIPNGVTSIGNEAFRSCTSLASITIPNSVTSIGESTFYNCTSLTTVTIPNSVTSIGDRAFYYCTGLQSVTIPNGVTSIGNGSFLGCTGLTSITVPNSVTSIGEKAFFRVLNVIYGGNASGSPWGARSVNGYVEGYLVYKDATKTTLLGCSPAATGGIMIPESVVIIGEYAFLNCVALTSITIPNSVTSIGERAFYNCTGLTSVTIGNGVTSIGSSAFSGCTGLTSVTIPNSVTSIGSAAFFNCTGLTSLTFDNSVTSIGSYAFNGCTGLTSITIPNSVTSIGERAFYNCTGLTSVTIGNGVTSIGSWAFSGCTGLTSVTIGNGVTGIGESTFYNCTSLTTVTIPNSVTSIGAYAFAYCTGLTAITIPNSVTSVGKYAFEDCTGLTSVEWNAKQCAGWSSVEVSPFYSVKDKITSFTFGDEVRRIPAYLCYDMNQLTSITIPNSVTNIGECAFYKCTGLTSMYVLAGTPPSIESTTFYKVPTDIPIYVPCGTEKIYRSARWCYISSPFCYYFSNYNEKLGYSVIAIPQNTEFGSVRITKEANCTDQESVFEANANEHYHFTQWSDGNTDNPRTFVVYRNITLTAEFAPNQYAISATAENGYVEGAGEYDYGTSATLTAVADEHYHFERWSDGNTDNPRSVSVEGEATYTAVFAPNRYTIYADAEHGYVEGAGEYDYGTTATLTAIADEHYHFVRWTDGNTDNPRLETVTQDIAYIAEFADDPILTVVSANEEMGTVSGAGQFKPNSSCKISANANVGYHFTQWNDGNTDNPRTIILDGDATYTAEFAVNQYTISTSAENGYVDGAGEYDYGTTITLTATANEHYHFVQWSDGNTDNPRTITIEGDATYTAEFAIDQFTITATCDIQYGEVTGDGVYDYGTRITLTAIPNSGYEFKQWSNGLSYNPYRFTVVSDLTLEAEFIPATAIDDIQTDTDTTAPQKVLIDGQVYILRNNKTYTLTGVEVK